MLVSVYIDSAMQSFCVCYILCGGTKHGTRNCLFVAAKSLLSLTTGTPVLMFLFSFLLCLIGCFCEGWAELQEAAVTPTRWDRKAFENQDLLCKWHTQNHMQFS